MATKGSTRPLIIYSTCIQYMAQESTILKMGPLKEHVHHSISELDVHNSWVNVYHSKAIIGYCGGW